MAWTPSTQALPPETGMYLVWVPEWALNGYLPLDYLTGRAIREQVFAGKRLWWREWSDEWGTPGFKMPPMSPSAGMAWARDGD